MTEIETLQAELGDLAADWLHENEGKQFLGFYTTREYVMPKTARYQNWLVFRNKKAVGRLPRPVPTVWLTKVVITQSRLWHGFISTYPHEGARHLTNRLTRRGSCHLMLSGRHVIKLNGSRFLL